MKNIIKVSVIAVVVLASFAAASSASAADFYVSVGSGSYPYYGNYFNSYSGYYGSPYISVNYGSNNWGFNYDYNRDSFWSSGGRYRIANPPKPANVKPITISGLGFTVPQPGSAGTPAPIQGAPAVTPTPNVNCGAGFAYNAGMNICLPVRSY